MKNNTSIMKGWLKDVIISLDICPFAKNELEKIKIIETDFQSEGLEKFIEGSINHDTTSALFFDSSRIEFEDLYSLSLKIQENLVQKQKDFQLIAFHPKFQFQGTQFKDKINLVNRSPYPTLHLLSNKELEKVTLDQDIGIKINRKNEELLNLMSDQEIKKYFSYLED